MARKKKSYQEVHDPHFKRESQQYEHPVPSREYILSHLKERGRPVSFKHLVQVFNLASDEEQEGLRRRLIAMSRDGQLISNRRGSYALVDEMELLRGRVQAHRDGFGFLIPDDSSDDIFLPAREMRGVFNDDVVLVRVCNFFARKKEGTIVEVLERNTHQVVGRYYEEAGLAFVDPDNKHILQDIVIPAGQSSTAKPGQFVVVEITKQPSSRRQPLGRVVEVLGDHLTAGMEVELAIRAYALPFKWPQAVINEAQRFHADISPQDVQDRLDLRQLPFVTIDGEDAKDFDDAVYCEHRKGQGWTLYVAVADVSHYVKPSSALDVEAQTRGNSVYFPARVIPMLPEILSNGLCSLMPHVDRLALVCEMVVSEQGKIEQYTFHRAVIHSHGRLTYTLVAKMLAGEQTEHSGLYPYIKRLYLLYKVLYRQRQLRGAVEFETTETKIEFDKKGKIAKVVPSVRNEAHRLIEEMMLAANESAAHFLLQEKIPALYRIHEGPQKTKLIALREFLKNFNLRLTGGSNPSPKDFSRLIKRVNKREEAHLLQTVLLRSLQQAVYSPDNVGHFGLAFEAYTHFTSPIRRYPDLIVHRAIKQVISKQKKELSYHSKEEIELYAQHCSMTERRADRASRDAVDWLKCEYMQDKVGQIFSGRIVEVTGFGVFVELDEIYVQGLLHITSLKNDYYHFNETHRLLRGKHSKNVYRLADKITVLVAKVSLDDRTIDFELAE